MDSHKLLLAAKARIDQKNGRTTFMVGGHRFNLKEDTTTGTGCNIYFYDDQAWRRTSKGDFVIYEKGVNICPIMDAIIVWFVYPDEALKMLEAHK